MQTIHIISLEFEWFCWIYIIQLNERIWIFRSMFIFRHRMHETWGVVQDKQIHWLLWVFGISTLTHWGRWCICSSVNWVIIESDNGLSPVGFQAISSINAAILTIRPQGIYFNEILFKIQKTFHSRKYIRICRLPLCPGLDVLRCDDAYFRHATMHYNVTTGSGKGLLHTCRYGHIYVNMQAF